MPLFPGFNRSRRYNPLRLLGYGYKSCFPNLTLQKINLRYAAQAAPL